MGFFGNIKDIAIKVYTTLAGIVRVAKPVLEAMENLNDDIKGMMTWFRDVVAKGGVQAAQAIKSKERLILALNSFFRNIEAWGGSGKLLTNKLLYAVNIETPGTITPTEGEDLGGDIVEFINLTAELARSRNYAMKKLEEEGE